MYSKHFLHRPKSVLQPLQGHVRYRLDSKFVTFVTKFVTIVYDNEQTSRVESLWACVSSCYLYSLYKTVIHLTINRQNNIFEMNCIGTCSLKRYNCYFLSN